ncbi:hypothetical protein [Clostridium estertheticum]|uniref:hypothetical protein n=1 Tax=Clostridium estertheticum TaxID=238834 RepID=UPI001C0D4F42|nr:hypothetical protein [Clostridium estertheticum]MBU3173313.1 hypothetical protein [Clostridium estertheticum]
MENKALIYSETYGIIEYKVIGSNMIFYTNYPTEKNTYKCVIDLETMIEIRKVLKRYYKMGSYNLCV